MSAIIHPSFLMSMEDVEDASIKDMLEKKTVMERNLESITSPIPIDPMASVDSISPIGHINLKQADEDLAALAASAEDEDMPELDLDEVVKLIDKTREEEREKKKRQEEKERKKEEKDKEELKSMEAGIEDLYQFLHKWYRMDSRYRLHMYDLAMIYKERQMFKKDPKYRRTAFETSMRDVTNARDTNDFRRAYLFHQLLFANIPTSR